MLLKPWEQLPPALQNDAVRPYYEHLKGRKCALFCKRLLDVVGAVLGVVICSPIYLVLAIAIKLDSKGPVFFKQVRVGQYGREFKIYKFRTMVADAQALGAQVTTGHDPRVTRVGRRIRDFRLDEFSQFINVLKGDMTFVGTRPEVPRYVAQYSEEMMATLLLRPGLTGAASIAFKDENNMLNESEDPEKAYVEKILPIKMKINLDYTRDFRLGLDFKLIWETVLCVFK